MEIEEPTEVNYDEACQYENWNVIVSNSYIKPIERDPVKEEMNICSAFCGGHLRPYTYGFFWSLFFAFVSWGVLLAGLLLKSHGNLGAISCMPLAYIFVLVTQMSAVIYQHRNFTWKELILWIVVNALYVSNGAGFVIKTYQPYFKLFTMDLKKRVKQQNMFSRFVIIFTLLVPFIMHAAVPVLIFLDRKKDTEFSQMKYFLTMSILLLLTMIASAFAFTSIAMGVGFVCMSGYIIFLAAYIFQILTKNAEDIGACFKYLNRFFTFLICIGGIALNNMSGEAIGGFKGMSWTVATISFFIWGFAIFTMSRDYALRRSAPVYVSPDLYPIYKFNPKTQRLDYYFSPYICIVVGFGILICWSFFANAKVAPHWFGAICSMATIYLGIITVMGIKSSLIE
jgi:hypothetical protein